MRLLSLREVLVWEEACSSSLFVFLTILIDVRIGKWQGKRQREIVAIGG